MQKKTARRKGETRGQHAQRERKGESIRGAADTRINKGSLAGLARKTPPPAKPPTPTKPTPTPTPAASAGATKSKSALHSAAGGGGRRRR